MEYKLVNEFKYYPKNAESIDNACTIIFDDKKFNIAKVQRSLAIIMNPISLKMLKSINENSSKNQTVVEPVEPVEQEKTFEQKIAEYKAVGFNLFCFLEPNQDETILKIMTESGCLYHLEPQDLNRNSKFLDSLDITDIYVIIGYYFINFTGKQLN